MTSFTDVVDGETIDAADLQEVKDALKGTAGKGIPISVTAVNDAASFALDVMNLDATTGRAFRVRAANATTDLLIADKTGVRLSPDGTTDADLAGTIVTTTATQTLTNKTLTSPVINMSVTVTATTPYTVLAADTVVVATGASPVVYLPALPTSGRQIIVKHRGTGTGTISADGGAAIIWTTAAVINFSPAVGDSHAFVGDGTYWNVVV